MSYTQNPHSRRVAEMIDEAVVIPVMVIRDLASAVPLARALARGGLTVLEITLRTEVALAAIAAIAEALPEVTVGSGTVADAATSSRRPWTMAAASRSAPAPRRRCSTPPRRSACRCCRRRPTPARPWSLAERGYLRQKLFPAEPSGGVALLKSLGEPIPQIRFCPTGGIDLAKAPSYLALQQRGLRRRLLGGAQGRGRGGRLGPDREAGGRGGRRSSVRRRSRPAGS